jgi:hypothetical protein
MVGVPSAQFATQRTRWLAELADALHEARDLVRQLGAAEGRIEAIELSRRIEATWLEVQAMRLRRTNEAADFAPEWSKDLPWKLSA